MKFAKGQEVEYEKSVRLIVSRKGHEFDSTEFGRGHVEKCPGCGFGVREDEPNDVMRMTIQDWHVLWCSCGTVWADLDGYEEVLAKFPLDGWNKMMGFPDEQADLVQEAQDRAFDAGIGYGG